MTVAPLIANGIVLTAVLGIPLYALRQRQNVVAHFIDGSKEGLQLLLKVLPHLFLMIIAVGMLRASGAFSLLSTLLAPVMAKIGMPTDLLPLALLRPFSGGASNAMLIDIIDHHGANSLISQMAATLMGSTETTFYVVAVYFGAVNIRKTRHAIPAGLLADFTGVMASILVCRWFFG